jgi:hypothetical protein
VLIFAYDLATSNPAKRDELLNDLQAWLQATDALIPAKPNPKYDPTAKREGGKRGKGTGKQEK